MLEDEALIAADKIAQVARLKSKLKSTESSLEHERADHEALRKEFAKWQEKYDELHDLKRGRDFHARSLKQKLTNHEMAVAELKLTLAEARASLQAAREHEAALQEDLEGSREQIRTKNSELVASKTEIDGLKEDLEGAQADLERARREIPRLKAEAMKALALKQEAEDKRIALELQNREVIHQLYGERVSADGAGLVGSQIKGLEAQVADLKAELANHKAALHLDGEGRAQLEQAEMSKQQAEQAASAKIQQEQARALANAEKRIKLNGQEYRKLNAKFKQAQAAACDLRAQLNRESEDKRTFQKSAAESSSALSRINSVKTRQAEALAHRSETLENQNKSLLRQMSAMEQPRQVMHLLL